MRMAMVLIGCILAASAATAAPPKVQNASDWPHFLGPNYDMTSPERGLLREWPEGGPEVLWRVPLGQGWNAPSVAGDDVVASWTFPGGQSASREGVVCFDADVGKVKWHYVYDVEKYWKANIGWGAGGVRASPCITEKHVFALSPTGVLNCLSRRTGKLVWTRNISDAWTQSGEKGRCFSPIVVDGKLIIYIGDGCVRADDPVAVKKRAEDFTGRFAVCVGLDPDTGRQQWQWVVPHVLTSRRGEGHTPIVAKFGGKDCIVLYGQTAFVALQASDGKEVWRLDLAKGERGTAHYPILRVGHAFLGAADLTHYLFRVTGGHAPYNVELLWRKRGLPKPLITFVYYEGCAYGLGGNYPPTFPGQRAAKRGQQEFVCVDLKTGEVLWKEKGFTNSASQILADGLIFARSLQTLHLVVPSPKGYVEKGRMKTHDLDEGYASMCDFIVPVLSRGRLFVRTGTELLCLKVAP